MKINSKWPRNKYRNKPVVIEGKWFASKKEGKRYQELKLLEKVGQIRDLKTQVRFPFIIEGKLICSYIADFKYIENGYPVIEDTKGMKTRDYIIKKKLMKAVFGIEIKET